jgi:hypothetical protein
MLGENCAQRSDADHTNNYLEHTQNAVHSFSHNNQTLNSPLQIPRSPLKTHKSPLKNSRVFSHLSPKKSRKSWKRSCVWQHVKKDINYKTNFKVWCSIASCEQSYICTNSSTTSVLKHLLCKHPEILKEDEKLLAMRKTKVKQEKISRNTESVESRPADIHEEQLRYQLAKIIIQGYYPFSLVEQTCFIEYSKLLNPSVQLISADTLTRHVEKLFSTSHAKVKEILVQETSKVSLTTDCWTSTATKSFLGMTVHWLDENWKFNEIVLDFLHISEISHSGKNLAQKIITVFDEMLISDKVSAIVLDNASNNDTMMTCLNSLLKGNIKRHNCFAHVLNLAVQDSLCILKDSLGILRKLVKKIKKSSLRVHMLKSLLEQLKVQPLMPILDVSTRWNSTYLMIERAVVLKRGLESLVVSDEKLKKKCQLTDQDWNVFSAIINFLQPFYVFTKQMSGSRYVTISCVIPYFNALMTHLEEIISTSKGTQRKNKNSKTTINVTESDSIKELLHKAASVARDKLAFYYSKTSTVHCVATALDPRFNLQYFKDDKWTISEIESWKKEMVTIWEKNYKPKNKEEDQYDLESQLLNSVFKKKKHGDQLKDYFSEGQADADVDVFEWWKNKEKTYPDLARMAKDFLSIPATSVPSERAFSAAGEIADEKRNRLSPEHLRICVCLESWMRLFSTMANYSCFPLF